MKKLITSVLFAVSLLLSAAQTPKIDSLRQLLITAKEDTNKVIIYEKIRSQFDNRDPDSALKYALKSQELSTKLNYTRGLALGLRGQGSAFYRMGNLSLSFDLYLKALQLFENNNDLVGKANVYISIGHSYSIQAGGKRDAINNYLKAKDYAETTGNDTIKVVALLNTAGMYNQINKTDSALHFAHEAFEICLKKNDQLLGLVLNILGRIHLNMGNSKLALEYFQMSLKKIRFYEDKNGESLVLYSLALFHKKNGNTDSSIYYAKNALAIAQSAGFAVRISQATDFLTNIYREIDIVDSAYKYQSLSMKMKDSLFNQQNVAQFSYLAFREQLRQQEIVEQKVKEAHERKEDLQMFAMAAIIATLSATTLLFGRKKARPKAVEFMGLLALLMLFEFISLLIHPFISHWTGHTPAFMLLILVAVAAVLVPMHHRLTKWLKEKLAMRPKAVA